MVYLDILVILYTEVSMSSFLIGGLQGEQPMPWAPKIPGLFPMDFLIWGCVQGIIYSEKVKSIRNL